MQHINPVQVAKTNHLLLVCTVTPSWASAYVLNDSLTRVRNKFKWRKEPFKELGDVHENTLLEVLKTLRGDDDGPDARSFAAGIEMSRKTGERRAELTLLHNPASLRFYPEVFPERYCAVITSFVRGMARNRNCRIRLPVEDYVESFLPEQRLHVRESIVQPLSTVPRVETQEVIIAE